MAKAISVNLNEVTRNIVIDVRIDGAKVFAARLWVGEKLIRLAGLVMGTRVRVMIE